MNRKTAIAFLLLVFPSLVFAQVKQRNIRLEVLKHNRIGREYIFKEEDQSTTHLTYLGSLRTKKGVRYKIINSVWIWGQSHRATNRILIYSGRNKYLGNYPITMINDLSSFIKDNILVFKNKPNKSDCDPQLITYIAFDDGMPPDFFRKCKGDEGDIYTLDKD